VWGPTWIKIHWTSIWLRARSHMTTHCTWGSATTLHDLGGVLGHPSDTFFWTLTISWSWLLAHVWSGPNNITLRYSKESCICSPKSRLAYGTSKSISRHGQVGNSRMDMQLLLLLLLLQSIMSEWVLLAAKKILTLLYFYFIITICSSFPLDLELM
jgi:hypothetical protein